MGNQSMEQLTDLKAILHSKRANIYYFENRLGRRTVKTDMALFEDYKIRRVYDEEAENWWFSVIDIVQILTQQADYQAARNYWKVLKNRLSKEGSEVVTNCNRLKMTATDGRQRLTDVATAETLLRFSTIRTQPQSRTDQTLARQSGLRAHAGNGRSCQIAKSSQRDLATVDPVNIAIIYEK